MHRPQISTPLPGPKAKALIDRDHQFLSPSLPREYPLVVSKGEGVWVDDPDGNRFLDFTSGIAVCNTGHCHPDVVSAAKAQLETLIHTCGADFYHQPMVDLAERLARITPGNARKRVYLGNSGVGRGDTSCHSSGTTTEGSRRRSRPTHYRCYIH